MRQCNDGLFMLGCCIDKQHIINNILQAAFRTKREPTWPLGEQGTWASVRTAETLPVRQTPTCEGSVGPDVLSHEASDEHQQHHEQPGPGEPTTTHLHLQVLPHRRRHTSQPNAFRGQWRHRARAAHQTPGYAWCLV